MKISYHHSDDETFSSIASRSERMEIATDLIKMRIEMKNLHTITRCFRGRRTLARSKKEEFIIIAAFAAAVDSFTSEWLHHE